LSKVLHRSVTGNDTTLKVNKHKTYYCSNRFMSREKTGSLKNQSTSLDQVFQHNTSLNEQSFQAIVLNLHQTGKCAHGESLTSPQSLPVMIFRQLSIFKTLRLTIESDNSILLLCQQCSPWFFRVCLHHGSRLCSSCQPSVAASRRK
jgi:hypothetical protein